jgi:peptide/nickel transport system substrate-binding protein
MSVSVRTPASLGRGWKQCVDRRTFLRLVGSGTGLALFGRVQPSHSVGAAPGREEGTLLVGANFVLKGLDPGRSIESTSAMILHATYDSLVTFEGEDHRTPKHSLATSWKGSGDGKTFTFSLRPHVKFVSGNPLTSADVKWSFDRILNLKANTQFLLAGVEEIQAPDPRTVVLRLKAPKPSILPILSSPSLSVLDSKLVMRQGGTAGPEAGNKDWAETYLNAHSAGTGAFVLASHIPGQEVVLVRNPDHWRGPAPIGRVVVRNIPEPATQALLLGKKDLDVATSLGQDQAHALRRVAGVTVKTSPVATTFYVVMNTNPDVGGPFAHRKIQQAVRYGLDYPGILAVAGPGAVRLAGVIPSVLPGAFEPGDTIKTDRMKARALLNESGLGKVRGKLSYASGLTIRGVQLNLLAQKIQADLAAIGIDLDLSGLPISIALQQYRDGKFQIGVWNYPADYPDASNFLLYLPGRPIGKRAGWLPDSSPAAQDLARRGEAAESEINAGKRLAIYQAVDRALGETGPYAPLFQPAAPYAFRSDLRGVTFNSVWGVDFFSIRRAK